MIGPNPCRVIITFVLLNIAFIFFIGSSYIYYADSINLIWIIGIGASLGSCANFWLIYAAFTDPGYMWRM